MRVHYVNANVITLIGIQVGTVPLSNYMSVLPQPD